MMFNKNHSILALLILMLSVFSTAHAEPHPYDLPNDEDWVVPYNSTGSRLVISFDIERFGKVLVEGYGWQPYDYIRHVGYEGNTWLTIHIPSFNASLTLVQLDTNPMEWFTVTYYNGTNFNYWAHGLTIEKLDLFFHIASTTGFQ